MAQETEAKTLPPPPPGWVPPQDQKWIPPPPGYPSSMAVPVGLPYRNRPQPPRETQEHGSVIVAKVLAGNLGTAPEIAMLLKIDERKMAVINEQTMTSYAYMDWRGKKHGIDFYKFFVDWELAGSQGVGGLARRHILTAMANSSGTQTIERAKAPNVLARNLWHRGWKKEAEDQGKIVE